MKKIMYIFLIMVLFIPFNVKAAIANSSSLSDVRVYVVTNDKCSDCEQEIEWLKSIKSDYIRLSVITIDSKSDKELVTKIKAALNIKKDDYPLTILGTDYFIGYSDKIKDKISNAIESYNEYDKHCELVTKIKDGEDYAECIKENKDIYKEEANTLIIIFSIIGGILIIIVLVIIYLIRIKKISLFKLNNHE